MGFNISNDYLQETCFVIAVVGVALSITATALRFVAIRRVKRRPSWEDWFSVLATFWFILYVIPLIYLLSVMNGTSTTQLTSEQTVKIKKAGYSMGPQFCLQQLWAKLSILSLYYRVFFVNQQFVYCVWFLGIFQTLWSIATFFAHIFECTPVRKLWTPTLAGHCISSQDFLAAGETPNSAVDFALIALAIWMVQTLRIDLASKLKLFAIFAVGGLAGILGFVKIADGFGAISSSKVELLDPIWASVQQTCSVICCCAPLYKPLIPETGFFGKLRSYGSQMFNKSRSSKSGGQQHSGEKSRNSISVARMSWRNPDDWVQLDEQSVGFMRHRGSDISSEERGQDRGSDYV